MTWSQVIRHPQLRDTDVPLLFTFTGATRYVPLLAGAGMFVVTIVLSLIGPIDWAIDNKAEVYGFLALCLVAMCAGYLWAVRIRAGEPKVEDSGVRVPATPIVVLGSLVYIVLYPLTVYDSTGSWFPNVVKGLMDPGQAYADKTAAALEIPQLATYAGMIVAPLTIGVLPLTLFFWPRLSRLARVLGVTVILLNLALGVSRAVNQDVGEIAGYVVLFLALVATTTSEHTRGQWRRVVTCVVAAGIVVGLFMSYYHTVISGRVETNVENSAAEDPEKPEKESLRDAMTTTALQSFGQERRDSIYYSVVPAAAQPTGTLFTSYLTQGYKGLSMAMDKPWHPTYGLGFSIFIRHNVSRLAGLDESAIEARTYEGQLDKQGWASGLQWSTFFIHPASDISFFGVIPFTALLGFAFGLAWRDTCRRRDPLACVVFFYLGVQVLYLSANNQLYQGGELAIGFSVLLVAWLVLRSRRTTTKSIDHAQDARSHDPVHGPAADGSGSA